MENLEIRRFDNNDATTVSLLIWKSFMEVNIELGMPYGYANILFYVFKRKCS